MADKPSVYDFMQQTDTYVRNEFGKAWRSFQAGDVDTGERVLEGIRKAVANPKFREQLSFIAERAGSARDPRIQKFGSMLAQPLLSGSYESRIPMELRDKATNPNYVNFMAPRRGMRTNAADITRSATQNPGADPFITTAANVMNRMSTRPGAKEGDDPILLDYETSGANRLATDVKEYRTPYTSWLTGVEFQKDGAERRQEGYQVKRDAFKAEEMLHANNFVEGAAALARAGADSTMISRIQNLADKVQVDGSKNLKDQMKDRSTSFRNLAMTYERLANPQAPEGQSFDASTLKDHRRIVDSALGQVLNLVGTGVRDEGVISRTLQTAVQRYNSTVMGRGIGAELESALVKANVREALSRQGINALPRLSEDERKAVELFNQSNNPSMLMSDMPAATQADKENQEALASAGLAAMAEFVAQGRQLSRDSKKLVTRFIRGDLNGVPEFKDARDEFINNTTDRYTEMLGVGRDTARALVELSFMGTSRAEAALDPYQLRTLDRDIEVLSGLVNLVTESETPRHLADGIEKAVLSLDGLQESGVLTEEQKAEAQRLRRTLQSNAPLATRLDKHGYVFAHTVLPSVIRWMDGPEASARIEADLTELANQNTDAGTREETKRQLKQYLKTIVYQQAVAPRNQTYQPQKEDWSRVVDRLDLDKISSLDQLKEQIDTNAMDQMRGARRRGIVVRRGYHERRFREKFMLGAVLRLQTAAFAAQRLAEQARGQKEKVSKEISPLTVPSNVSLAELKALRDKIDVARTNHEDAAARRNAAEVIGEHLQNAKMSVDERLIWIQVRRELTDPSFIKNGSPAFVATRQRAAALLIAGKIDQAMATLALERANNYPTAAAEEAQTPAYKKEKTSTSDSDAVPLPDSDSSTQAPVN